MIPDGDNKRTKTVPTKTADNLNVDDRAILDCWNLSVASHEVDFAATGTTATSSSSVPSSLLLEKEYRWEETVPNFGDVDGFEEEDESENILSISREELEKEEQQLMQMASAPIPDEMQHQLPRAPQ